MAATNKISLPDLHWYAAQLLYLPEVLGSVAAEERCREIGKMIFEEFGHEGMVAVCHFVRDDFDYSVASHVERAWDGIGSWLG